MKTTRLLVPSALLLAAAAGHASDVRFQTVAVTGDPAPGLGPLVFDVFSDPRLNTPGQIAFWADLAGPGVSENTNGSIWTNRTGAFAMVAREGDAAPVGNGLVWGALPTPAFNDQARLAFTASLFDPAQPTLPTNLGIFREASPGPGIEAVAREGDPAPGGFIPPVNFANLPLAPFNSAGHSAFAAINGLAIWSNRAGTLQAIRAAGTGNTGVANLFYGRLGNPYQRADGKVAFFSPLLSSNNLGSQPVAYGLFSDFGGQFGPVAATGQPISGISPIKYKEVSAHPAITIARLSYWATMVDGGVTPLNDSGIWVTNTPTPNGLPLVREGDAAPGAGPGVFFGGFSRHPSLAGSTSPYWLAFGATLIGDGVSNLNNSGIWLKGSEPVMLVAREGDQVPRLPAGTFYASFGDSVVNGAGQVFFTARLRGPAVTQETSVVLMGTERPTSFFNPGNVVPLARTGDAFPIAPGQTRKVDEIYFDQGQPGSGATAMTDAGRVIFKLAFRDPIVPPPPPPQLAFTFTQGLFTATVRCLADINADGVLTVADFGAFQTAYVQGDLRVCDFNEDGTLTVADFGAYQTAFVAGCP